MFPEGEKEGRYHTADASLWYFHAIDRYLQVTGDRETLQVIGTFGIKAKTAEMLVILRSAAANR